MPALTSGIPGKSERPNGLRLLVTGGCGFIGGHVVEALLRRGDRVIVADRFTDGEPSSTQAATLQALERAATDAVEEKCQKGEGSKRDPSGCWKLVETPGIDDLCKTGRQPQANFEGSDVVPLGNAKLGQPGPCIATAIATAKWEGTERYDSTGGTSLDVSAGKEDEKNPRCDEAGADAGAACALLTQRIDRLRIIDVDLTDVDALETKCFRGQYNQTAASLKYRRVVSR
eukprot:GHVT01064900.1.p1 GENE.GHVT01064900.1~~GHVT01064900.1.p1  ORF type:complete len:230 (+),score=30.33 GHVT01064900.1:289-978(+)